MPLLLAKQHSLVGQQRRSALPPFVWAFLTSVLFQLELGTEPSLSQNSTLSLGRFTAHKRAGFRIEQGPNHYGEGP